MSSWGANMILKVLSCSSKNKGKYLILVLTIDTRRNFAKFVAANSGPLAKYTKINGCKNQQVYKYFP